jgi:Spy/CpxP family protein refolding chaperone
VTFKVRRPPRTKVTTIAMICISIVVLPAAVADPMELATEMQSTAVNAPQRLGLTQEIAQFRSRIALAQVALNPGQQDLASPATLSASQPAGGTVGAALAPIGAPNTPANDTKAMPMAAGCCAGMMGQMGVAGAASTTMASGLPGFPGASHLYHVGATGFFLEYSAAIKLTMNQQAALNAIKEISVANQASAQRQIDQAEQELWILTSSDQPDLLTIETKLHAIENLKSEQRIAFIRSVGEAARMLSKEQRGILLGTIAPVTAPMPGATNDSMGNMNSGDTPKPKSDGAMGDM